MFFGGGEYTSIKRDGFRLGSIDIVYDEGPRSAVRVGSVDAKKGGTDYWRAEFSPTRGDEDLAFVCIVSEEIVNTAWCAQ